MVPPRTAQTVAAECGLQEWASSIYGFPSPSKAVGGKTTSLLRTKTVNIELKKWLLRTLLEVYMDAKYVVSARLDHACTYLLLSGNRNVLHVW